MPRRMFLRMYPLDVLLLLANTECGVLANAIGDY
jgi:hypothetical protein